MEADIPRVLHRVLLVIVGAEAGNLLETKLLRHRQSRAGRLSVDLDADPSVDQPASLQLTRRSRHSHPRLPVMQIPPRISLRVEVRSCATSSPVAGRKRAKYCQPALKVDHLLASNTDRAKNEITSRPHQEPAIEPWLSLDAGLVKYPVKLGAG